MISFFLKFFNKKCLASYLALFSAILIFFGNTQVVFSLASSELKKTDSIVVEYLRLNVPEKDKEAWLLAERDSWGLWLEKQKGFIDRKIFWDPDNEEALLLISWTSRLDWKKIPKSEIDKVQKTFEKIAMDLTNKQFGNPFPITFQGEFLVQ